MKTLYSILTIFLLCCLISVEPGMAQKEKEAIKKGRALFNKIKSLKDPVKKEPVSQTKIVEDSPANDREAKKRKLTPPDVRLQINNAGQAYASDDYTEARFYIQQAIMGIELEIGYQILKTMPEMIKGIKADKEQDEVYSTGAGFAGMIISREYPGDEGSIKAAIANNNTLYSYAGMQASMNAQTMTGGDETSKVIRYKGNKAYLEADDYAGYKMMVPFGQSSIFVLECSSCDTEANLLEIADLFDIEKYKSLLGEQ
jgi:hypothetical protein